LSYRIGRILSYVGTLIGPICGGVGVMVSRLVGRVDRAWPQFGCWWAEKRRDWCNAACDSRRCPFGTVVVAAPGRAAASAVAPSAPCRLHKAEPPQRKASSDPPRHPKHASGVEVQSQGGHLKLFSLSLLVHCLACRWVGVVNRDTPMANPQNPCRWSLATRHPLSPFLCPPTNVISRQGGPSKPAQVGEVVRRR